MKPIQIGNLSYERPLFMAPMEGITDVPFRKIVRQYGCGITCTQMIHADGLLKGEQSRMHEVTAMEAFEQPVGMQLCGSEANMLAEAAKKAEQMGAAFIDLNMGCPAKNVVARGAGAALLKSPELSASIIRAMKKNVTIPITVKIRAGWDNAQLTGLEIAQIAEKEGACLVSVHGRTRAQQHKGDVDWNLFDEIKQKVKIPVVGNGGVNTVEDIQRMFKETNVDGVMLARGALGNPWLFSLTKPRVKDVYKTLSEHYEHHLTFYPRKENAVITFRKHIVWYTKGLPNAAAFRISIFKHKDVDVVKQMLHEFFTSLHPEFIPCREDGTLQDKV